MRLRDRLLLFSSAQLVVFGLLFGLTYVGLSRVVFPLLEDHLRSKADTTARELAARLDVALGADDPAMVRHTSEEPFLREDTLAFVRVADAMGVTAYQQGSDIAGVAATAAIRFEGIDLGRVTVIFNTSEIDRLRAWAHAVAVLVLVVWLAALAYSVRFARAFVAPIDAMKDFTHAVATGNLTQQLDVAASAELEQLRTDLNAMARELASRERERQANALRTDQLQRELVAASRMAGMAEVATGVLHNVGNVLNSLNVSVALVDEQLRTSKISALARCVRAFGEHPGGLAGFLATPAGEVLPDYLAQLAAHLAADTARARAELAVVTRSVEHIKTIVATQQTFAAGIDVREPVEIAALVDDALRIGAVACLEAGVEIVREYAAVPTVVTDRHGVLQSLINLISNARHALLDADLAAAARRLVVRVRPSGQGIAIDVVDNGVGIATGQMPRLFEHGFTTKKRGHGFGLHASANTVRQLGGSLSAVSGGRGHGATFTLELPIEAPRRQHALAI